MYISICIAIYILVAGCWAWLRFDVGDDDDIWMGEAVTVLYMLCTLCLPYRTVMNCTELGSAGLFWLCLHQI